MQRILKWCICEGECRPRAGLSKMTAVAQLEDTQNAYKWKKKLNKLNLKSTLNVAVHHTPVTELILSVSKVKVTTCTTPYWPYYNHNRNKIQQVSSSCHKVKTDPSKQSNPQQTYNVRVSTVRFTIKNQISVLCFNQLWNILRELTPLLPKNN